ncbi:hypothetical protein ABT026_00480 [Streptomyces sp. NPDC002734]|uniref:hypothetical protein n=1 Tax=Streptomyces sp. NPDC002734 TaxID=3154426 RepID=UPI0033312857
MICRNFIAPTRAFTQLANEIIRHPRLSSDAARVLTWQLSLPPGATETLSETAKRARIGGSAFTTAKRQLIAEGYVHERRAQIERGRWATRQLVSSVPLRAAEADKFLAALPTQGRDTIHRVSPQVAPSGRPPAAGGPTTPLSDGPSLRNTNELGNTSHHPGAAPDADDSTAADAGAETAANATAGAEAEAAAEADGGTDVASGPAADPHASAAPGQDPAPGPDPGSAPAPAPAPEPEPEPEPKPEPEPEPDLDGGGATEPSEETLDQAWAVVAAFPMLDPELRGIPRAMRPELTRLTARWLAAGHTPGDIRTHILRGLPTNGAPVLRPGGLLRYLLTEVPPLPASRTGGRLPETPPKSWPLRECESPRHDSPVMFRPVEGESLCPGCLGSMSEGPGI